MDFEFEHEDGFLLYRLFNSETFVLQYLSTFLSKSTKCECHLSDQLSLEIANSFIVFRNIINSLEILYVCCRD
jgi:hypothetical protein